MISRPAIRLAIAGWLTAALAFFITTSAIARPIGQPPVPDVDARSAVVEIKRKAPTEPAAPKPTQPQPAEPATQPQGGPVPAAPAAALRTEAIEVDVSTRTVAVTSAFSGVEIVVFGSVDNSRQESAESGYYDIVVVVEGASTPAIVREKKRTLGVWANTRQVRFETMPLYRAVASTRPIEEIADVRVLAVNKISVDRVLNAPGATNAAPFKDAAIRLKRRDGLYVTQDFGVAFIGRSLFRAGVKLPANIPVGPLEVRVMLFKDGNILASRAANVRLERQGLERLIYDFAYEYPFWYGMLAVGMAIGAGLLASAVFQRQPS
jgi:uncharacterized protein (TIGR02186 family)